MSSPIRPLLAGFGLLIAGWAAASPGAAAERDFQFEYELAEAGRVTWVIEDAAGGRVRNLLSAVSRSQGHHAESWDGRNDAGQTVRGGTYVARGLYHQDLDLRYEFSFGNPGDPPWPTRDGTGGWLANHSDPLDVLVDGERVYLSAAHAEGPSPLIALDAEGNRLWGGLDREHAGFLARSGNYLYIAANRGVVPARNAAQLDQDAEVLLTRVDPATGQQEPFPDGALWRSIIRVDLSRAPERRHEGEAVERGEMDAAWAGDAVTGLATYRGQLYVASYMTDEVLQVDPGSGQLVRRFAVPKPAAIAAGGDRLLVATGRAVVSLDTASGRLESVVSAGLAAPVGLAVGGEGAIYVSDWGDEMCVKVFASDGRLLRRIGSAGGRPPLGPYDPQGMFRPRGLDIDSRGRLWVAENDMSPRRLSVWDTRSGELLIERVGHTRYGGQGTFVFPDRPDTAWMLGNSLDLDWQKGVWRVAGTPWRPRTGGDLLGLGAYSDIHRVVEANGRRFVVHSGGGPARGGVVVVSEWRDGRAIPRAAMGSVLGALPQPSRGAGAAPPMLFADQLWRDPALNRAARSVLAWWFKGPRAGDYRVPEAELDPVHRAAQAAGHPHGPNTHFIFTDHNGDGAVAADEVKFFPRALRGADHAPLQFEMWSHGVVDGELALYFSQIEDGRASHYRFPVTTWTDAGAPVYAWKARTRVARSRHLGLAAWVSAEQHLLAYGDFSAAADGEREPLVMYRPNGTIAWTYPSPYSGVHGSHRAPPPRRGLLAGPLGVIGSARVPGLGEMFALHTNLGQAVLFTADGLYIDSLFQDVRSPHAGWPAFPKRGQSVQAMSNGGEWFGGQMFQTPPGDVYVVGGRTSADIARITGLDQARRLGPVPVRVGGAAAPAQREPAQVRPHVQVQALDRPRGASAVPMLAEFSWDPAHRAAWHFGDKRAAQASWSYDATHLYLAFRDVEDETPFENASEDPALLHTAGDALIFELAPPRDEVQQAAASALRLVIAPYRGEPVVVLAHAAQSEGKSGRRIDTPAALARLAQTRVLDTAQVRIRRSADRYDLVVAVPQESLGLQVEAGRYRGDFGVVYGAAESGRVSLRMHWANQNTGLISDVALQDRLEPQRWGHFEVSSPVEAR